MNSKIIDIINKVSRKRKIKYQYVCNDMIVGTYYGFNDNFSEFLDITFIIQEEKMIINIVPDITFEYLNNFNSLDDITIIKLDDNKIKITYSTNFKMNEIEEKMKKVYDSVFSKKVRDYYFHLLVLNWKNKHDK